ncbi:hypothetical protein EVAR_103741_1 [Eumeta japonica]|uniref:Uncharacterized protein n=1 Tax=Eumeta variegata TaxID=151549 RepID=A0A4C1ZPB4_EUMVA|nr:hypothetical protein EVAR_103741_1 [Eumeta japonica]
MVEKFRRMLGEKIFAASSSIVLSEYRYKRVVFELRNRIEALAISRSVVTGCVSAWNTRPAGASRKEPSGPDRVIRAFHCDVSESVHASTTNVRRSINDAGDQQATSVHPSCPTCLFEVAIEPLQ